MDETGQAGSPDEAGAYPGAGRGRGGYPEAHANGATPGHEALEALVSAWREPATGMTAGRASIGGASIHGTAINGTSINGSPINGSPINGTSINGIPISGAPLNGALMNGASMNGGALAGGASINGGSINGGSLNGTSANGAQANGAASNATLNGATSNSTTSNGTTSNGTTLNGATLNSTALNGSSVHAVPFNGTPMHGSPAHGTPVHGGPVNGASAPRGRAEVRSPYSEALAPVSPPVPAPQPPTSTLHYGHYGPDGQGWPGSGTPGETAKAASVAPPPGTVYGALSVEHSGDVRHPVSAQPAYETAPQQPYQPAQPAYETAPQQQPYQPAQAAYQQVQQPYQPAYQHGQQAYQQTQEPYQQQQQPQYDYDQRPYEYDEPQPAPDREHWGYQGQYQQEQRHWAPEPDEPEFDWAAPGQQPPAQHEAVPQQPAVPAPQPPAPAQRVPEDDPLVGPLPPVLLGSATAMTAAEPVMPTFADEMNQPEYDPPGLPQRVPSEPDVPPVPAVEPQAAAVGAPELTRITNYLREDEDGTPESPDSRPDGFDVQNVLRAVQAVTGVHRATLRKNADGLHTLRLELLDEADAGQVSRIVARMLNETMGLSAEPSPPAPGDAEPAAAAPATAPSSGPALPARPARNQPHSALPGYGRDNRRRRPVSSAGRRAAPEEKPAPPVPNLGVIGSPRVVIESVDVSTQGVDATVEVRLTADNHPALGVASGPNFDGYMLKLAALAAASAVDQLLTEADTTVRARCYIEHAAVVPMGGCEVAVVVLLLMYDGYVEQLTGSAVVSGDGDSRQAVVRATMAAVNRRLEALLP